jgi:type IV pilus assembly protein PilB
MESQSKRIGELLVEKGLITKESLEEALKIQKVSKEFLGAILVKNNLVNEEELLKTLAEKYSLRFIRLKNKYIDWDLVKGFSSSLILDHKCFPVKRDRLSVTIAISNPLDIWAIKKAEEEAKGASLVLVLATEQDIREVTERYLEYMRGKLPQIFEKENS